MSVKSDPVTKILVVVTRDKVSANSLAASAVASYPNILAKVIYHKPLGFGGGWHTAWHIPLTFIQDFTNNSSLKRRWLSNTFAPVVYTDVVDKPDRWIICNHKVFGYYRVDYDDINWDLIQNQLQTNHTQIHVMNRAQLIDDALTLAEIVYNLYKIYDLSQNIIEENHWHIPLTFTQSFSNNSTLKRRWLGNSSEPAVYTDVIEKPNSWIICNHKVFGYYRVDYDEMNWDLIQHQLENNHQKIHVMNRAQIIDDALNLASASLLVNTYKQALDLTSYSKKEFDWLPCETAWKNFERMQNLLSGTEAGELLNSHIQRLALHLYELYTFNENPKDKHLDLRLRKNAVRIACGTNFAPCVEEAKKVFVSWTNTLECTGGYHTAILLIQELSRFYNQERDLIQLLRLKEQKAPQLGTMRTLDQAIEQVSINIGWMETHYVTILEWLKEQL
ncbi:aminopeptidase N-like [Artemia franciscana]|uniref:aminopeptidase N-like n=1 Tax=Artemia franciscana TaxID=6661 RepID=UPI0032DA0550